MNKTARNHGIVGRVPQILWAWPAGVCALPPYQLSTTNGLTLIVQP
jgi:hypothetical protein